jgi:hypothetical protein
MHWAFGLNAKTIIPTNKTILFIPTLNNWHCHWWTLAPLP